jgi:hypothetical protein
MLHAAQFKMWQVWWVFSIQKEMAGRKRMMQRKLTLVKGKA